MLKARNKKISLLLVLAMLMTMFVGVGTAGAASTYSAGQPMNVVSGSNPNFSNVITIEVAPGTVTSNTYARFQLPSDFGTTITKVTVKDLTGVQIKDIGGAFQSAPNNTATAVSIPGRVFELYIASGDLKETGRIAIELTGLTVDPGFEESIVNVEFIARPGSGLNDAKVPVAKVGSGMVELSMESVKTITADVSKQAIDKLYIKEDTPGALKAGTNGVELKLPSGFEWVIGSRDVSIIWGQTTAGLAVTTQDSGRTLVIGTNSVTNQATYFEISDLEIKTDDSVAKLGDINARLGGKTSASASELLVAKYGDYGVIVESVGDPKTVVAGKYDQEIGAFRIKEGIAGSLIPGRNVTLEIIGNAKWNPSSYPVIDSAKSKNAKLGAWAPVGTSGKIIRANVNSVTGASDMVFHKAELMVAPTAPLDGDIKIKVTGNTGIEETIITIAKAVPPVMGKADQVTDVRIGVAEQKLAPIVITELVDEAIDAREGRNQLWLVFPQGVVPKVGTMTVEVLEGDMTIDLSSRGVNKRDDGRWYAFVTVTSTSMTPAKVKFDNIYVTLDRTVAEGPVDVRITGSALNQTINWFPGDLAVGAVTVAKAITPAPGEVAGTGKFVIGSNIYEVNGAAKIMDVAPYIKGDRTYVPMRYLGEILGAEVVWDADARTVTLTRGDDVVVFTIGNAAYTVNGEAKTADVAPEITKDRTMLPARYVAEAFGAQVGWDATTRTVLISN